MCIITIFLLLNYKVTEIAGFIIIKWKNWQFKFFYKYAKVFTLYIMPVIILMSCLSLNPINFLRYSGLSITIDLLYFYNMVYKNLRKDNSFITCNVKTYKNYNGYKKMRKINLIETFSRSFIAQRSW